jgi:hypothetical protein
MRGLAQPTTEVVSACFAPRLFSFKLAGLFFRLSLCNMYYAPQMCVEFAMIRMDGCGNVFTPAGAS